MYIYVYMYVARKKTNNEKYVNNLRIQKLWVVSLGNIFFYKFREIIYILIWHEKTKFLFII